MKCVQCQGYKTDTKHLPKFLSLRFCQKSDCWRDLKFITNLFEDFSENAQYDHSDRNITFFHCFNMTPLVIADTQ